MITPCPHCQADIEIDAETRAALAGHTHFQCPACTGAVPVPTAPVKVTPDAAIRTAKPSGAPVSQALHTSRGLNRNLLILGTIALLVLGGIGIFLASRKSGDTHKTERNVLNNITNNTYFQDLIAAGTASKSAFEAIRDIHPYGNGYIGISAEPLDMNRATEIANKSGAVILDLATEAEGDEQKLLQWIATTFPEESAGETIWMAQGGRRGMFVPPGGYTSPAADAPRKVLLHWGASPQPMQMATIPRGEFLSGEKNLQAIAPTPLKAVDVDAFLLSKTEVTQGQWNHVRKWAQNNGYTDLAEGRGVAADHPVQMVSWYDVVKWCNARSEMEGLTPCYYDDSAQTVIYRNGDMNLGKDSVKWSANGYRLPTAMEWEKAARGGLSGKRFPWGNTISHADANFCNSRGEPFQRGTTGFHPLFSARKDVCTAPVGSFAPNNYGLFDMAGNIHEWCWDPSKGNEGAAGKADPTMPDPGNPRALRGGGWNGNAFFCRIAREDSGPPEKRDIRIGFRVARSLVTDTAPKK